MRRLKRLANRIEVAQVRRWRRSLTSVAFRTPVLLLTTTGRRSGRPRHTVVAYQRTGEGELLVVGGAAGQERLPDWVANLRADPAVTVTVEGETTSMTAVELTGVERDEAWAIALRVWPRVERYEARAGRAVPIIQLTSSAPPPRPTR